MDKEKLTTVSSRQTEAISCNLFHRRNLRGTCHRNQDSGMIAELCGLWAPLHSSISPRLLNNGVKTRALTRHMVNDCTLGGETPNKTQIIAEKGTRRRMKSTASIP